ncbi:hypothetical protein SDC9_86947 [bioreactor metagenome]|uniref:Uncharacterized protein n=1 Tax=bioreactor metagenome TaxID=1076179 RepID=A0A644ZHV7_9ZZZZ
MTVAAFECEVPERFSRGRGLAGCGEEFTAQRTGLETVVTGHQSARRAGGPAVFIVQMGLHAEFFGFIDGCFDTVEPFFFEIGRGQTDAGVHEKSAHAHLFHDADLPPDFRRFEPAVPRPERRAPKTRFRLRDLLY